MIYLDTSVLLAFTLTKDVEPERFAVVSKLFALIEAGRVKAVTSFYALHELLIIAISSWRGEQSHPSRRRPMGHPLAVAELCD
jgi:predicted nucleic acid-binding protein